MKYRKIQTIDDLTFYNTKSRVFFSDDQNNQHYQIMLQHVIDRGADVFEDGVIPQHVQQLADQKLFDTQLLAYKQAKARLDKHVLSEGMEPVVETRDTFVFNASADGGQQLVRQQYTLHHGYDPVEPEVSQDIFTEVVGASASPLFEHTQQMIKNPLIVQDEQERAAAQQIVDNTPDAIKLLVDSE